MKLGKRKRPGLVEQEHQAGCGLAFDVPRDPASSAVDDIEDEAGEGEPLGAHDSGDGRDSSLKRKLNLGLVLVLRGEGHGESISLKEIATEAGNSAADIQYHTASLSPGYAG